jgi:hypothetical protein
MNIGTANIRAMRNMCEVMGNYPMRFISKCFVYRFVMIGLFIVICTVYIYVVLFLKI